MLERADTADAIGLNRRASALLDQLVRDEQAPVLSNQYAKRPFRRFYLDRVAGSARHHRTVGGTLDACDFSD